MLVDTQGRIVKPESLPKGRKAREAALATLREVHAPQHKRAPGFCIEERARLANSA